MPPFTPFDPDDPVDPATGEIPRNLSPLVEITDGYLIPADHFFEFLSYINCNHDVRQGVVDIVNAVAAARPPRKFGIAAAALRYES